MRPHLPRARQGSAPTTLDRAPLASTSLASLAEQSPSSLRCLPVILQRLPDVARTIDGRAGTLGYLHQRLPSCLDVDLAVLVDHHHPSLREPTGWKHLSRGANPRLRRPFGPPALTRSSRLGVEIAERGRRRSRKRVARGSTLRLGIWPRCRLRLGSCSHLRS